MTWLIEDTPAGHPSAFRELYEEAVRQGHRAQLISTSAAYSGLSEVLCKEAAAGAVLFQGSLVLAERIQKVTALVPGAWGARREFECDFYYPRLQGFLFNDQFVLLNRDEFQCQQEALFQAFGRKDSIFIRPVDGAKSFAGQVLSKGPDFEVDWDAIESTTKPESALLISTPKTIRSEFRTIVDGQRVVAATQYRRNGRPALREGLPESAREFVATVLRGSSLAVPDPLFILDLAEDDDGRFWVLEIGAFSCSGLYACNLAEVISTASVLAMQQQAGLG